MGVSTPLVCAISYLGTSADRTLHLGQVFQQVFTLIDPDTPPEVMKKRSLNDPSVELQLVFSDEFNKPGRSFYPGDDPFWEAVDLNYWSTWDVEWYGVWKFLFRL